MIQRINKKHDKSSSKKSSGFVYKERSSDSVKKRAEQTGGRFDSIFKSGFDTFKPKSGSNVIRFLPPTWDGHDHYGLDVWVHGFVGPNRGSYLCLQKMKNKKCPLCNLVAELRKGGETEEANKVAARKKVLTWIIDRDGDDDNPLLYLMGWTIDRDVSDLARNKRTGETLLIDHPDEGYDVSFTRKGERLNTDYFGWQIARDSSPIADKQKDQDGILEYIQDNPLPDVLHFVSADKLEQVVEGTAEEPDEDDEEEKPRKAKRSRDDSDTDDEEEDRPTRKRSRRDADEEEEEERPRRRASRDEDDSDDEPADDDDGEDDKRASRKKRHARDEDDTDEQGSDDEDDDEDTSSKKRRRSRDDEDENEDEEEEDRPRRGASSRKARDEDDSDEDERPAKRVRTRPARDEDEEESSEDEEDNRPSKKASRRQAERDDDEEEND